MVSRIVIFALIVGVVYLNYTNPKIEHHQAALMAELEMDGAIPEALHDQIWRKVDYSNFMVCSFIKTTEGSDLISTGFMNKVKVVDDTWAENTRKSLQRSLNSY